MDYGFIKDFHVRHFKHWSYRQTLLPTHEAQTKKNNRAPPLPESDFLHQLRHLLRSARQGAPLNPGNVLSSFRSKRELVREKGLRLMCFIYLILWLDIKVHGLSGLKLSEERKTVIQPWAFCKVAVENTLRKVRGSIPVRKKHVSLSTNFNFNELFKARRRIM